MNLRILNRQDVDTDDFDQFVRTHPYGMLYYTSRYLSVIEKITRSEEQTLVALHENGSIEAVMPLFRKRGPLGDVLNSSPFFGSHGAPIARTGEGLAALIAAYKDIVSEPDVAAATIIGNPFSNESEDLIPHDNLDHRICQFTRLDELSPSAHICSVIEGSARRNIKKAQRAGYEVRIESDMLPFVKSCHYANMEEIGGTPKPKAFFDEFAQTFRAGRDYDIYVARKDGEPISALLVLFSNWIVEYFVPVTLAGFRSEQPLPLILASAMSDAAAKGFRIWNWGGTWPNQIGVYRFKKKWNAYETGYRYFNLVRNPAIYRASSRELVQEYGGFYVVPFHHRDRRDSDRQASK